MKTTLFFDSSLNSLFHNEGYIIVDLLSTKECDDLLETYKGTDSKVSSKFYTTFWSESLEHRKEVDSLLKDMLMEKLTQYTDHFRPIFSNFMVKKPGENGECLPHQDWNYVEEDNAVSITLWCALQDTDSRNGGLNVMPKSHKIKNRIRGRNIQPYITEVQELIRTKFMKNVVLKKGQALLLNSSIIHGSENNLSKNDRVAVALMAVPKKATCIHYAKSEISDDLDETIYVLSGDNNLFVNHNCFENIELTNALKTIKVKKKSMSKFDLYTFSILSKLGVF